MENAVSEKRKPKVGRPPKQKSAGRPKNRYRSFKEAVKLVRKQNFEHKEAFLEWARTTECPHDIPTRPDLIYKDDFISYDHFIGKTDFLPFEEARALTHTKQFKSQQDFMNRYDEMFKRPLPVPKSPYKVYSEWNGWQDFLGYDKKVPSGSIEEMHKALAVHNEQKREQQYRTFIDAVKFVSTLNLKDYYEWVEWRSKYQHSDLPWKPDEFYRKEWQGWKSFLGHDPLLALLDDSATLFIAKHPSDPQNVFRIGSNRLGSKDTLIRLQQMGLKPIRMYNMKNDVKQEVDAVLYQNCSVWWDAPNAYIVHNIYDLFNALFDVVPLAK